LFAWCRHVNVAKFVTPPRTAVLRSRGGVTHSGETRLTLRYPQATCCESFGENEK